MTRHIDYTSEPKQTIAFDMCDPKQWLYVTLEQIIKENPDYLSPEEIAELKTNLQGIDNKRSTEIPLHKLYQLVYPLLNEDQKQELYMLLAQEVTSLRLTQAEREEMYLYTRITGPMIAALLRRCECIFTTTSNRTARYNGKNEEEMAYFYNLGKSEHGNIQTPGDIFGAIRRIDRIIHNAPPLKAPTYLYRGCNEFYVNGEITKPTVGSLIKDDAFVSTSLLYERAYHQNQYIMVIRAPAGTKGVYMGTYGVKGTYSEDRSAYTQEYLLAKGTTFKITSIGIHAETAKYHIECEVVSQEKYSPDNVVDFYGLRSIPADYDYDIYNKNFNQFETGIDIKEFIKTLVSSGLLDRFYEESADMQELYKSEDGTDVIDHGIGHVQRVMLYVMYLGRQLNLSDSDMDILICATKYHDVGIDNGHYGHGRVSAQKLLNILHGKLPQSDLNKIAAIIECHEIDDDKHEFNKIFKRYKIPKKEREQILRLLYILKDADALDRTRFRNNLNTDYLRNRESLELVKTSYQMQEIRGNTDLNERIKNSQFTEDEIQQIEAYRLQKIPDYVIAHSFATYSIWRFRTASEMINKWMNTSHGLAKG